MFHTYVANVLSECCICLKWFSSIFHVFDASVSETCLKCFICLQTCVTSIASRCFKSRSGVAHEMHVGSGREHERSSGDVRAAWALCDRAKHRHRQRHAVTSAGVECKCAG
jgi:hypothetical protein